MRTSCYFLFMTALLGISLSACSQADNRDFFAHDYSNRISIAQSWQVAGFNQDTEGWEGYDGTSVSLSDAEVMRWDKSVEGVNYCIPEGSLALLVRAADMPANRWRGARKVFQSPIDLSENTIMQFKIFTQEDRPGANMFVRVVLGDGKRKYELRSEIIPALWATPIFDISRCPFLSAVKSMEIDIMNDSGKTWADCRFLIDDVRVGKPLDLNFMLAGSSQRFSATGGQLSDGDDMMRFQFGKGARLSTTDDLLDSRNSMYNPPIDSFNTFHLVMANHSAVARVRLSFKTEKHNAYSEAASKVFDVQPNSDLTAYFFNLSDNPLASGKLTGFMLEPVEQVDGVWEIDKMAFLKEQPIETYAGSIESCRATADNLIIKGRISSEYATAYPLLQIYEAPHYKVDGRVTADGLKNLEKIYEGTTTADFEITSIANSRLDGRMTRLSMRMLAVISDGKGRVMKVAPYFWIENWRDFEDNPYAFELPDRVFSVLDYGAKGDGFTDDTDAINRAIDACHRAGGGKVVVPGTLPVGGNPAIGRRYVATNIIMKSNVDLHLEEHAVIWQSGDMRDYKYHAYFYHNMNIPETPWTHSIFVNRPLIQFVNVRNVKLTGKGTILMYNNYTFDKHLVGTYSCCPDKIHIIPVGANQVENMEVNDVSIVYSPSYFTKFQFTENLFLGNVKMLHPACSSGDGIGLAFGGNIKIARCIYYSNDDGITLVSSYNDPRNKVSPWRQIPDGADHSLRNVTISRCYIDCLYPSQIYGITIGNVVWSHALAFIPWGNNRSDLCLQEIDGVQAYDNMLRGGWAVGVWPDTPFDGKPFTNDERDDFSPIKNVYIHDNDYISPCGMLWVTPTNFTGDTGIHSASQLINGDFSQGHAYWTLSGDAGAEVGYGYARSGGSIMQGLYLAGGKVRFMAQVLGKGTLQIVRSSDGAVVASTNFDCTDWEEQDVEVSLPVTDDYLLGITAQEGQIRQCRLVAF